MEIKDFLINEEPKIYFETTVDAIEIRRAQRNEFFQTLPQTVPMKAMIDWERHKIYPISKDIISQYNLTLDTYYTVPCVNIEGSIFLQYYNSSKLNNGSYDSTLRDVFIDATSTWLKLEYDRQRRLPISTKAINQERKPVWPNDLEAKIILAIEQNGIASDDHPYLMHFLGM